MKETCALFMLLVFVGAFDKSAKAQTGGHILYGDVKVDESNATGLKPISFDIILYNLGGSVVARQTVSANGRYRFLGLGNGHYDLALELESVEIARIRVEVMSPFRTDYRQDISLEWKSINASRRPASVSAADYYQRTARNQKRFAKAQEATDKKDYPEAAILLQQILADDSKDFQAWTELGTVRLAQKNLPEAEKAYGRAVEERPQFFLGLMNLGRLHLMQKNFGAAILVFSQAVDVKDTSAEANYYLGEAYLQVKKGSAAVGYLNEAIKLDPIGKADVHLRLAALYNAAGMKDKAAAEYEAFLKKKPDHPNKKKLEQYIAQNKKP